MNPDFEMRRLLDVMPASGRMATKLISKPEQRLVVDSAFPMPWVRDRPIWINFDLWDRLPRPQRDLLILRTVSWLTGVKWFQPSLYQGVVLAGVVGGVVELVQGDPVGMIAAAGLTAIAGAQIWRNNRSNQTELDADEAALRVAQRRGYEEPEAARHLLSAIEAVAQIEGRSLNFIELLRSQNLRAIAGLSPVGVPDRARQN
jgi:GNAT superfamily N-acetyltransferase